MWRVVFRSSKDYEATETARRWKLPKLIAQLVEHNPIKVSVVGSNPTKFATSKCKNAKTVSVCS